MRIALLDPSIGDGNLGNQIITEAVLSCTVELFPRAEILCHPCRDNLTEQIIADMNTATYSFFGGTNVLSAEMDSYRQWGIHQDNAAQIQNLILFGVGWWQYQGAINDYTKRILRQVLHPNALHAARDSYTVQKLRSIGIENVLMTSCPTVWSLTPQHCQIVPSNKAESVVCTVTDYNKDPDRDRRLLEVLQKHYWQVYFWPQGGGDTIYLQSLAADTSALTVLPYNLKDFDELLRTHPNIDYVGTRLHGGIRALQHGRRSLILGIDNRALEISRDIGLPVLHEADMLHLERVIQEPIVLCITLPTACIDLWKQQFTSLHSQLSTALCDVACSP